MTKDERIREIEIGGIIESAQDELLTAREDIFKATRSIVKIIEQLDKAKAKIAEGGRQI